MKEIEPIIDITKKIHLDSISWSHRSYVKSDLDPMVTELFQEWPEQRRNAGQVLENACALQGSLSEAAFYLIPFIHQGLKIRPDRAESALSLFVNMANSLAPSYLNRVFFRIDLDGFYFYVPDKSGLEMFLDHACQMALTAVVPTISDGFRMFNEEGQMEAISFVASIAPCGFAVQWLLGVKQSQKLSPAVSRHLESCLQDPVFERMAHQI